MLIADGLAFNAKGWSQPVTVPDIDVPLDSELANLSFFLDAKFMGAIWACNSNIRGHWSWQLESCHVVYVRYKPRRYCHVFYHLTWSSKSGDYRQQNLVAGKVTGKTLSQRGSTTTTVLRLNEAPGIELRYTLFAQDSKISSLQLLAKRHEMETRLRNATGEDCDIVSPRSSAKHWCQVLSYRPERYCLLRFTVQYAFGRRDVFARIFHDKTHAERAWRLMCSIWSTANNGDDKPIIPQPIGYDQHASVCFYAAAAGEPLTGLIQSTQTHEAVDIAAKALMRIHTHQLNARIAVDLPVKNADTELDALQSICDATEAVDNIDTELRASTLRKLRAHMPPDDDNWRLLHGDYSTNQIITDSGSPTVIDMSGVRGNIHIDVGRFITRFSKQNTAATSDQLRLEFLNAYHHHGNIEADERQLVWFEATAMVKDAFIPMKKLRRGWPQSVNSGISRASKLLNDNYP